MTTELKAYTPRRMVRCPVALPTPRFEGNLCRCVREDDHAGECRLIDGIALTDRAYAPHERYALMGLEVPERLRPALARVAWWRRLGRWLSRLLGLSGSVSGSGP